MSTKQILIDKLSFWYDDNNLFSAQTFTEVWGSKTLYYKDSGYEKYLSHIAVDMAEEIDKSIVQSILKLY